MPPGNQPEAMGEGKEPLTAPSTAHRKNRNRPSRAFRWVGRLDERVVNRLHVYWAEGDRGIAIIPNASHHEASMRWTRGPWAGPQGTYKTSFEIEDWRVDVSPIGFNVDENTSQLSEF